MAIYTKKGDRGETRLFGEDTSRKKDDLRIRVVGSLDELNSQLGFVLGLLAVDHKETRGIILNIQKDIFEIAAEIASPGLPNFILEPSRVRTLEKVIDDLEGSLPALANFIFPGGSKAGAAMHVARSVCRRAEREIVSLSQKEEINKNILIYINRLSDVLFMIAREINRLYGKKEDIWKGK